MKKNFLIGVMILILGSSMIFAQTHKNAIFGAYVTYKSSTEITVTAGSGRCNDTFWEISSSTDVNLSGVLPAEEDFLYIYIDDSASSYPTPTIIGSTTEPAWSDSNIGWYNGDDRCIGVVWCDTYGNIVWFQNNSNLETMTAPKIARVLEGGNPDSTYQTLECTAYIPVNATAVRVFASNSEADNDAVIVRVHAYETLANRLSTIGRNSTAEVIGWISLGRGWSRDLKWYGYDNDDNSFDIDILGFRIDR